MWVESPIKYKNRDAQRTYDPKSIFLKDQYLSVLKSGRPVVFVKHKNLKARDLIKLRIAINAASKPGRHTFGIPMAEDGYEPAHLTGIRTGAFGVALREFEGVDQPTRRKIKKMIGKGAVMILSLPSLEPPHLLAILRGLDKAIPRSILPTSEEKARAKADIEAEYVPGKEQQRLRPITVPELGLAGALIEGRAIPIAELREVAALPSMDALYGQIVGLLSQPPSTLVELLSQAGGGKLLRTLRGYQQSFESTPPH